MHVILSYDTDEYRVEMMAWLKSDCNNSQRIKRDRSEFYSWLMSSSYFGDTKAQKLYNYLHQQNDKVASCEECDELVKFVNIWKGYNNYCSNQCANQSKEKMELQKQTLLKNYGVTNPSLSSDIQQRKIETNLQKYGETHFCKTDKFIQDQRERNLEKWDVEWNVLRDGFQAKLEETSYKHYGTRRPPQSNLYWEENKGNIHQYKDYVLPSGKVIRIQGYEAYLMNDLLCKYNEDEIITQRYQMPTILYKNPYTQTESRYFPDAFVEKEHMIYECKSEYTWNDKIIGNIAKVDATAQCGYDITVIIYNRDGNVIETITKRKDK